MLRTPHPTEALLASLSVFRDLRSRDRREIAHHFEHLQMPAGQVLIHEDRPNRFTYFVLAGRLEVVVDGRRVASIGVDEFVGERTLLGEYLANATVTAAAASEVLAVDHRALLAMAARHPAIADRLRSVDDARAAA